MPSAALDSRRPRLPPAPTRFTEPVLKRRARVGCSGDFPPPSPPAEKAAARQDHSGQSSTDDGGGDRAGARSNRQPRLWLHLFGLIQLCGLLREKKVCTSDIWRSRRSSS